MELHAYACEPGVPAEELAERMRVELIALWPEAARLRVRELRARVEAQAPAFTPGSHAWRPGVRTDADGLYLAGDGIRTDFPSALMERSAATGIIAANHILRAEGGAAEPVRSIRPRGPARRTGLTGPGRAPGGIPVPGLLVQRRGANRANRPCGSLRLIVWVSRTDRRRARTTARSSPTCRGTTRTR